jgi:hypothetical protein
MLGTCSSTTLPVITRASAIAALLRPWAIQRVSPLGRQQLSDHFGVQHRPRLL